MKPTMKAIIDRDKFIPVVSVALRQYFIYGFIVGVLSSCVLFGIGYGLRKLLGI